MLIKSKKLPVNFKIARKSKPLKKVEDEINLIHHCCILSEDMQLEIYGFQNCIWKTCCMWIGIIMSAGFLWLFLSWKPNWRLYFTCTKSCLRKATKVKVMEVQNKKLLSVEIHQVKVLYLEKDTFAPDLNNYFNNFAANLIISNSNYCNPYVIDFPTMKNEKILTSVNYFCHKKLKYLLDWKIGLYVKLPTFDVNITSQEIHFKEIKNEMEYQKRSRNRKLLFGTNNIKVKVEGLAKLFFVEVLTPFYMFQFFSVLLWYFEGYYFYSVVIIFMSLFSICLAVVQTQQNQKLLSKTVGGSDFVDVLVDQSHQEKKSSDLLIPGDIIIIPNHGCQMHCDAVVMSGMCIVDESMLTGESIPVSKTSFPVHPSDLLYSSQEHGRHTLYCGTKVIQARYYNNEKVLARVLRTGYMTSKGKLVRSILYPRSAHLQFNSDLYKFIMILFIIAFLGFIYSCIFKLTRGFSLKAVIIQSLDLFTIAIPPVLPAAMTVGTYIAVARLKKLSIYCINSSAVNVSGILNLFCFDKTGTMTEEGLELLGVIPCNSHLLGQMAKDKLQLKLEILTGLATCHSLTTIDRELIGDPLDLKMFQFTKWTLEEPEVADKNKYDLMLFSTVTGFVNSEKVEFGIVKEFPFLSKLQTMSVIVRNLKTSECHIFCKGSPEAIYNLLNKQSGDNMHTALSVARESRMIEPSDEIIIMKVKTNEGNQVLEWSKEGVGEILTDPLSVIHDSNRKVYISTSGKSFSFVQNNHSELLPYLLKYGIVFARMNPDQKKQIIQLLQDVLHGYVGMIGDGANDCGALKTAHVGISLSDTEASIASPFTFGKNNTSCVPDLIREGRAALTTAFGMFKFLASASLTQFITILILYFVNSSLSDFQFLYIDLCLITSVSALFGSPHSCKDPLVKERPCSNLISLKPIVSLVSQILLVFCFQFISCYILWKQAWYSTNRLAYDNDNEHYYSYETYTLFSISCFQYITLAIVFSKSAPFRKPIFTHKGFSFVLTVFALFSMYLMLYPTPVVSSFFELKLPVDWYFRIILLGLAILHFVFAITTEDYFCDKLTSQMNTKTKIINF